MTGKRIPLCRLLGFQVWIDWSWFILAVLIAWSLATGLFPVIFADAELSSAALWSMGAAGAIGLFVSIVLHELGHSVVARQFGMRMRGITLFIFGGVAEMTDQPPSAKAEFFVAVAGPAVSVLIGSTLLGATAIGAALNWPTAIVGVTGWLGWINLVLVAFNLVPAFPLDGGRVLRAGLWRWTGDLRRATRITSGIGRLFGLTLIVLGVLSFITGNFVGGVWWIVLGLFLRGAAAASYQQMLIRRALEGEPVARFMSRNPVAVSPDASLQELVEKYFYQHYYKMYPVTDDGHLIGCVSTRQVKQVPRDQWPTHRVAEIVMPCSDQNTIDLNADAMQALTKLNRSGESRLMVVDDDHLVGILALKDLLRFFALRVELEEA